MVSIAALLASIAVAVRQFRLTRGAAHLSLGVDILGRYLESDFAESERIVMSQNFTVDNPSCALIDLPEPLNLHAYRVATLYQMVGYLSATGATDRKAMRHFFGLNAVRVWKSLEPYIKAQREQYPNLTGYRFFEDLAARSSEINSTSAVKVYQLRSFN